MIMYTFHSVPNSAMVDGIAAQTTKVGKERKEVVMDMSLFTHQSIPETTAVMFMSIEP